MKKYNVKESDFEESFSRSRGAGGQNVNKVATCVTLIHTPTGLQVKCMKDRTQILNRFLARRMLVDKIEEKVEGKKSAKQQKAEKIRRQKKRRSRRAKKKMVDEKRHRSKVKSERTRTSDD